jgi:predicted secreted protein
MRLLCALLTMMCSSVLLAGCESLSRMTGVSFLGLPKPVRLTADNSGANVRLVHGQQMIVRLPRDPAMGDHEWALREPISAPVKAEGAPVYGKSDETWTFTPVRPGKETLRLEYRRASQPDAQPAKVVSYNVAVP